MNTRHQTSPEHTGQRRIARTPKSRLRTDAVLAAARAVFSERGYEKSTTLEIAQRVGVSEATVFSYFGSKRALCVRVISDWYDGISQELETEVPRIRGFHDQLKFIVSRHLQHLMRDGTGLCALVLSEGRRPHNEFSAVLTDLLRRYTAPLMSVLAEARAQGEIRSDIPLSLMRDMVYGTMEHLLWQGITRDRMPDIDGTTCKIVDMLWNAFSPPKTDLQALRLFHAEVTDALKHYSEAKNNHDQ
uniref:TetR/AcrR family transcriptional regulator n=1 Tax=Castellaniella defragrans TaxID=75697 RepID=UPI00333E972F